MTYQTKMFLRLAVPAVVVLAVGTTVAFSVDTVIHLPLLMGGQPVLPGIGEGVALGYAWLVRAEALPTDFDKCRALPVSRRVD